MIYDNSFIPSFCKENILLDKVVLLMLYDLNSDYSRTTWTTWNQTTLTRSPGQPLWHAMHIKVLVYWIQHVICVGLIDEKTGYIMRYAKLIV